MKWTNYWKLISAPLLNLPLNLLYTLLLRIAKWGCLKASFICTLLMWLESNVHYNIYCFLGIVDFLVRAAERILRPWGKKGKARPPASEASRRFLGPRNKLWKITAVLLYEAPKPWNIVCYEAPWTLRPWGKSVPHALLSVALLLVYETKWSGGNSPFHSQVSCDLNFLIMYVLGHCCD